MVEEAEMQALVNHENVPKVIDFHTIKRQSILQMQRAQGIDLEKLSHQIGPLPPELVMNIAIQIADILQAMRNGTITRTGKVLVHGDIKPSNIVFNMETQSVQLIDWGSSVWAQMDVNGQPTANNVLDLMSADLQHTNARMGDVYFIGPDQISGELSSPRFDEQGLAATLYALGSGQSCRYGNAVITPSSLGLPKVLAKVKTP